MIRFQTLLFNFNLRRYIKVTNQGDEDQG